MYGHSLQTLWNTDNGNSDYVQKVSLIRYSFTRKVSQALAGFVPGLALTFIGYQPNVDQSAGTIFGLKVLFFAVPAVACTIAFIIFFIWYPLTDKRHKQIVKELALREEI